MKIAETMEHYRNKVNDAGARIMLAAVNAAGRAMNTKAGRSALIVPIAIQACALTVSAESGGDAQAMIDKIMELLGPGVTALGSLVAVVGGIQTGVGFKDDNADGKTRGFQTLIGGAIIAGIGGVVSSMKINLGG